jgi:hypothetical protein
LGGGETRLSMPAATISSELERALVAYAEAAVRVLQADVESGAEVELELGSQRGGGSGRALFYSCKPMSAKFIAERQGALEKLPEHGTAVAALAGFDGLDRYVAADRAVGVRADRSEIGQHARARAAAKRVLLDVFAEQTEFELNPERLAAALAKLERADLTSEPGTVTLVATLHGLAIASPELKLTKGLTIATPQELRWAPPEALAAGDELTAGPGHLLVALTCAERSVKEIASEESAATKPVGQSPREAALAAGLEVLKDLLRALRLFGDGRVTLGPLAWARFSGEDSWTTLAAGRAGRPHGMLVVSLDQEDELRAFCNLVSRRSPSRNDLAWALRRFELGCERAHPYEALSDHLLALRALLEPDEPGSGRLAGRLAALCAMPEHRTKLAERIVKAQKLERAFIAGAAPERAAGLALAREVADHLRALLRDVICGHLSPDLTRLADELLSAPAESVPAEPEPAERDPAELGSDRGQGALLAGGVAGAGAQQVFVPV